MADTEFSALITQLAERTDEGKVNWKATSNEYEFVIYFRQFALSMRYGTDSEGDDYVVFSLRNDAGKKVDEHWVFENGTGWTEAEQMWSQARRRVLKIDEVLEGLIGELQTGGQIGDEPAPPANDADEELPF